MVTLTRLKWLAVRAPVLFLGGLELVRQNLFPDLFSSWPGYLLLGGVILLGTLFFAEAIFGVVGRLPERLSVSEYTVKYHLRNILQKFHLQNREQVIASAVRHGLVDPA